MELYLQGNCAGASKRGTGISDCIAQEGEPTGFAKTPKSWKIPTSGNLPTEAEFKELIQGRKIFPFRDKFNFDDLTPDNEQETSSFGIKRTNLLGKPEFQFDFVDGREFHVNAYDHQGYNDGNIVLYFEKGIGFATDISESQLKGFDAGDFSVSTYKFKKGSESSKTMVKFQLKNAEEFNKRMVFYTWEQLGYDANFINGIINTKVSFQSAPTTGTTVNVYVKVDQNRSVDILGLTDANNWVVGGVQATPAMVDSVSYNAGGYYVLTLDNALVSTDTISVALGDVSNSYEAAQNASGDLYTGISETATIS